jgi:hypothetical protein
MLRRGIAVTLVVTTAWVSAGCDGDVATRVEEPTQSEQTFSAAEVQRAFRRHGLPLEEPSRSGPMIFQSEGAGPVFQVDVYFYVTSAKAAGGPGVIVTVAPAGYRVRGRVVKERRANVVVTYETGRTDVRRRVRAALAELR